MTEIPFRITLLTLEAVVTPSGLEAERGQPVGITCRGVLKAVLMPAPRKAKRPLGEIFDSLRGSLVLPSGETIKSLIEEGRR